MCAHEAVSGEQAAGGAANEPLVRARGCQDAGRRAALAFGTISAARPGCYAWSNRTTPRSSLKPSESRDLGGEVVDALAAPARRSCGRLGLPVERRRACRRTIGRAHV